MAEYHVGTTWFTNTIYARTPIYNMRHTAEWWKEELEKEKWENWTVEQNETD